MGNLENGDTLLLADGTYNLTSSLYVNGRNDVIIRGTLGSTNVVLVGKGMDNTNYGNVPFGIWSNGTNTTIAHLTIRDTWDNEIIFNPGAQSPLVYCVRLINAGSQFLKSNPTDVNNGIGVNNGLVEYCWFEYNLSDAPIHLRDSAQAQLSSNLPSATLSMFVSPATGDLHLLASATNAIDKGLTLSSVTNDIDGDRRPRGASSDIGADEFTTNAPPRITGLKLMGTDAWISLTTFLGESYDLLAANDLGPGLWSTAAANRPGAGAEIQLIDTNGAANPRRFYKARLTP